MSSTERVKGRKAVAAGLWVLIVLELLGMGVAGVSKFQGDGWQRMFEGWGYAAWFALVIGAAEMSAALMLTARKLASYAAMLLIVIMLGAIWTVLTNETRLGPGIRASWPRSGRSLPTLGWPSPRAANLERRPGL